MQSPYVYALNNPIRFIDKNGDEAEDPIADRLGVISKALDSRATAAMVKSTSPSGVYDSQVGRFVTLYPKAESYYPLSPYAYAANNPIKFIDVRKVARAGPTIN